MAKPAKAPLEPRHFLRFSDFSRAEYEHIFERTRWIKAQFRSYKR